ncbi:MAG: ribonuclease Y [Actinobacteria bacterium RBG_16_64_13]|nr:MAG: ribonuclease Y [Actinobacteria bacterium RBG_16_64_13]
MMTVLWIVVVLVVAIICAAAGFLARKYLGEAKISSAEQAALKIRLDAQREAESIQREARVELKDEMHQLRTQTEAEVKERRQELTQLENRLLNREEGLDELQKDMARREQSVSDREAHYKKALEEVGAMQVEEQRQLEEISGMSKDQAAEILLKRTEDEVRHDMAKLVRSIEDEARHEGERRAKDILSICIQRNAASHVADTTVSVVPLPSDDMKGRIIGREGRNVRTLENLTGVDFIIDDTPEAVVLSGFDTVRREIARLTLSKLVADGRIHPAKIEEMYSKAREEVEKQIQDAGEQAVLDANVHGVAPELLRLLGRLKFRTSYGQNVLMHSLEVAHLAGLMANELGVNAKLAKRAGLLHDLGKAVDHEVEGSHAAIGGNLARRYGESEAVAHIIEAHHNEVEPTTVEAVLVAAGDAVSGARPGARRETLETYIKRLESLERIAESKPGVEKCYAIQAGREIRVLVKPDEIDDSAAALLCREIAKEIEQELDYPGTIRVTVIRESRAVEYAK